MSKTKKTHDTTTFTLSHSSLSIIEQCPRKWFLRYIKGYYFDTPQPWSDFGLMAHEVGEKYRGEGIDRIKELAKEAIKNKRLTIHDSYKHKVPVALRNIKRFKYYQSRINPQYGSIQPILGGKMRYYVDDYDEDEDFEDDEDYDDGDDESDF